MAEIKKTLNVIGITVACVVAIGFLLFLVDEGSVTGKFAAVTSGSTAEVPLGGTNIWLFITFVFVVVAFVVLLLLRKKVYSKKK